MKLNKTVFFHKYFSTPKTTLSKTGFKTYTHVLLSVRQNLPQSGKKLDPCLLCQCCGNVTQLDKGTEQRSRLRKEQRFVEPCGSLMCPRAGHSVSRFIRRPSTFKLSKTEQVSGQSKNTDSERQEPMVCLAASDMPTFFNFQGRFLTMSERYKCNADADV